MLRALSWQARWCGQGQRNAASTGQLAKRRGCLKRPGELRLAWWWTHRGRVRWRDGSVGSVPVPSMLRVHCMIAYRLEGYVNAMYE